MRLFGLYEHRETTALEANHRKFCEANSIPYEKHRVANYYEKFRLIYHIMQENPGETLLFIDSHSYFSTFDFPFSVDSDLLLQEKDGGILDNFIVVKSTARTISLFRNHFISASSIRTIQNQWEFKLPCPPVPMIPKEDLLDYPHSQNDTYLNIDGFAQYEHSKVLVRRLYLGTFQYPDSFANLLCDYKPTSYTVSVAPFEVINPGHKNALVTLYTEEIKGMGAISEQNVAAYCKRNDITYYIYREIPEHLRHISGAWCKPYLLLNHFDQHDFIGWIDSDVLITPGYRMDFIGEVRVYNDPGDWYFNSGFMIYKNTTRNKALLQGVIRRCDELEQRHVTHVNGSDQTYFIQEYKEQYPDLLPLSNLETNCLPGFHHPESQGQLIHFMGIRIPIRTAIMDAIQQQFMNSTS